MEAKSPLLHRNLNDFHVHREIERKESLMAWNTFNSTFNSSFAEANGESNVTKKLESRTNLGPQLGGDLRYKVGEAVLLP